MTPPSGIERLRQVARRASDVDRAIEFYRDVLGATFVAKFVDPRRGVRAGPVGGPQDEAGLFGPPGEEEWMAFFRDPDGNLLAITARR